jgi:serine/threonine-protein kinase
MSPSRIAGRYELQEQLGEGGMGIVWRALDVKTGSYVAIKLMKDISDPVAVELFTKEWKALAEISHPNIVEVRDVDVIDENREKKPFFVMPLLRGSTLADLIADASARLTLKRIVEITSHVCRGLQAAHQRGLVHRDLKPSNIFVMDDDTAKIIDFGVVHLAGSKSVTGQKGTFQYMSPEQAQLRPITPASDLFSLGVILYEALTLRKPFARKTADETMEAVIKYIPPPVSEINPSINQSVSKVVHKCLAKQPIHRFTSARELAETLQKAARDEPVFDSSKIEPRIERAKAAFKGGDYAFASEILEQLETEGNLDPRITVLRMQIDLAVKQNKIRSLLESARSRMEQEEIPLALDKIREVLELDPQNSDALAMRATMEKQRNETQIAKWLELAQTHLGNRDFSAARNAAQEVLAIRRVERRALDLLEQIESTEADAKRIRDQKEQLYSSALRAYQDGEIESALSKLERLFSVARANPSAAIPERDAVYQSFFKEVRSERDSIHSALEDAQRQFSEKNFAGALALCRGLLVKYPNDGTFQGLKIRIEDAERQELSSYIAELSKRLDGEPDLDRRVNIVREASERYPNETQFAQQLKLIRERRDLVNSIVAKARQYEERGQYAEAISQWDILRNIHPQYPGIAFELEQCKKKRDRQTREEEHTRLIEEIDGLMESRAYAKAMDCADAGLVEFPGDAELSGMRTLAEQGLERTKESRRLFEEGQQALAEKDLLRATELLRSSLNLDPRGPGLRDAVVNVLAERGRSLVDEDWREAEPLCQEASELDASHPAVRSLRSTITEAKRQTQVGQCLAECRALVAAGKVHEAAERIRTARAEYPKDPRLEQYEATLQKEVNEARRNEERGRDRAALGEVHRLAEQNPDRANLRAVLERSYAIRAKHPDDREIGETVAEIELSVKRVARVEDLSELLNMPTVLNATDGRAVVVSRSGAGPAGMGPAEKKGPRLVDKGAEKTKLFESELRTLRKNTLQPWLRELQNYAARAGTFSAAAARAAVTLVRPAGKWSSSRLGVAAGILIVLAASVYFALRTPPPKTADEHGPPITTIPISTNPSDCTITSDGKEITNAAATTGATIEVSHLGYRTAQVRLNNDGDGKVTLQPEPVRLSVQTSANVGAVELDNQKIGDLTEGVFNEYDLSPDGNAHTLTVKVPGRSLFTVELQASAGGQPRVTSLNANDLLVISSLGGHATVYGGNQIKSARLGDQNVTVTPTGTDVSVNEQNHELVVGTGRGQSTVSIEMSNAPILAVQSVNADGEIRITTNAEHAMLTVNGTPVQPGRHGWILRRPPGSYKLGITAEGFEPQSKTVTLEHGKTLPWNFNLAPSSKPLPKADLVITNATPGAAVELDGKPMGYVNSSGTLILHAVLAEGKHRMVLSKSGFDPLAKEFSVTLPNEVQISDVKLTLSTVILAFRTDVGNIPVTVKFRREGEQQFSTTPASQSVNVPLGKYHLVVTASGYKEFQKDIELSKESTPVELSLTADPFYLFEQPAQVKQDGDWFQAKNAGTFVQLKPGNLSVALIFADVGKKTMFWDKKKVEWLVELSSQSAQVHYLLEGHKLTRKLVVGQNTSSQATPTVDAQSPDRKDLISLHIRVNGQNIQIMNDRGVVLDNFNFTASGLDFTKGRIAFRAESRFFVRSE